MFFANHVKVAESLKKQNRQLLTAGKEKFGSYE